MIISSTFALAGLTIPTFAPTTVLPSVGVFCYDSRYARDQPNISDCAAIIGHKIAKPPMAAAIRTFARHPTPVQFPLPYTWRSAQGECNVTIDIPDIPGATVREVARASMLDIKLAALEVFRQCVSSGDELGGFVQTGSSENLFVRVEAGYGLRDEIVALGVDSVGVD
ncbi:MAG: hypothetical protein Q9208_004246 [Pyrenodesmia sp. 3 TL-2023]